MAIVEMKRVSLLAPAEDEASLLELLQRLQCVHLTPAADDDASFSRTDTPTELAGLDDRISRVGWAIGKLNRYDPTKKPFLGDKPSISLDDAHALLGDQSQTLMRTVEALEALERESGELRGQASRIAVTREQLTPWAALPVPVNEVHSTRNTMATLGTAQKSALDALISGGELSPLCDVNVIGYLRETAYLYLVAHKSVAEETLQTLKKAGFATVSLNDIDDTVNQKLSQLDTELMDIDKRQQAIIGEVSDYGKDVADLRALYDCLCTQRERLTARQNLVSSKRTFYLTGWTPDTLMEKLEKRVHELSPSACIEFSDPAEGEEPPVLLENGPVVSPYESIVSGFSLPSYTGIDPTAVMMPFFANFMGMMVSDAGYGILMVLLCPLLIKLLKPGLGIKRMMWILTGGGVATIIWGALYNTWFGFGPWPSVFDPVNNALPVMGVCVGLGAVHLFAGLGVAAYMNIKRGKIGSAIADQLSWFLLVLGLIIMVLPMFAPGIPAGLASSGQWLALAGAAIILVTSGREKSKNPFKRLISGLGALYGVTSWVSDLLSYMRLFGMGLATGVIGMVFNQLVGMIFALGPVFYIIAVPLFVFCHLFNAGINILGAYVHSCRLQYIEFFGKFYEEGGKPFVPLSSTNRYCYIKEAQPRT